MSATIKLPCVRFVKRVSNGGSFSKYGYIGMMQRNGEALKTVPWLEAATAAEDVTLTTNQLTKTDGKARDDGTWEKTPSYTAYMGDMYDAYCQAGDAVARNATMCGYAGCVAYRFDLPALESGNALESLSLPLQRDRYLRSGVRVAACLSNDESPSGDWAVVRGEAAGCVRSASSAPAEGTVGASSFGFLGQPDIAHLTDSVSAADTLSIDTSTSFADAASYAYLYVYLTVEDHAAYWDLYKEGVPRQYYIEGSAMLVAGGCGFTFTAAPASSTETVEFVAAEGFTAPASISSSYDTSALAACTLAYINGTPRDASEDQPPPLIDRSTNQTPKNLLAAVRQAYAMFHAGQAARPSAYDDSAKDGSYISSMLVDAGIPGASFCVCINPDVARLEPAQRTGCVILSRRVALHRFVIPGGFAPSSVRFDWRPVATIGNVRLSAWIQVGPNPVQYGDTALDPIGLYTAADDSCGDWRRIATFLNRASLQTEGEKSLTAPFPTGVPSGSVATILLTAYAEPVASSFTSGDVIGMTQDANGAGVISTLVATAGWRPTITLIK